MKNCLLEIYLSVEQRMGLKTKQKVGEKLYEFSLQILEPKTENEFHIHVCY